MQKKEVHAVRLPMPVSIAAVTTTGTTNGVSSISIADIGTVRIGSGLELERAIGRRDRM
jgi:hypothetical protein